MKRIFILSLILICTYNISAQSILENGRYIANKELEFEINNDKIIFYYLYNDTSKEYKYSLSTDGCFNFISFDKEKYIVFSQYSILDFINVNNNTEYNFIGGSKVGMLSYGAEEGFGTYTATSYLTETVNNKKVSYTPENMAKFDNFVPWVENKEGYGLGEKITITSILEEAKNFVLYNGYFDPQRLYLYKANGRIKRALIKSEDFDDFEAEFQDTPNPQIIEFPNPAKTFTIVIVEAYPGIKFEDLCISAITRNINLEVYPPIPENVK